MYTLETFLSSPYHMCVLFLSAILFGMSKTGIQGIATIAVPIMAVAFGAKESTGVVLPMLCFADIIAVIYYRRAANWRYVFKLLPAAIAGFFVAIAVDNFFDPRYFKYLMAFCIFLGLFIMIFIGKPSPKMSRIFESKTYGSIFGLLGGFTTMIGNAAGPVMSVYMLSVRLPKVAFVGTSAWFFMFVNYLKIPLQVFAWDNISVDTLLIDACAIPFLFVGALFGIWFVKRIPEKGYRIFILITTALSAVMLLF